MTKVSVIIPIYNSAKGLRTCLDSLASQTLGEMQVLLVDDGSTDDSAAICREYTDQYPWFFYYYKENGGSASARNVGLEHADGEYIGFVDSDDWVEPDMFEKMYRFAKDAGGIDMVFNAMVSDDRGGSYCFTLPKPGVYDFAGMKEEIFPHLLPHPNKRGTFRSFDWGNWSKLIKKEVIDRGQIRYCQRSRRCEDLAFAVECTIHAETYGVMPAERLYHYTPSETSKSRHYTKQMWQSIRCLMEYLQELLQDYEGYDFREPMRYCILYFAAAVIRNEVFGPQDGEKLGRIRTILQDELCRGVLDLSERPIYNKEYTAVFSAMRSGSARRVDRVMRWFAWKKKYAAPVLTKLRGGKSAV